MKYALSLLSLSILITTYSSQASARSITSLSQSDAITAVAEFLYDVGEDVQSSTRITDKKINLKELSNCVTVTSEQVLDDVDSAIRKVMRFYPDEDVPFEQALYDMEDYLDNQSYKKCSLLKKTPQSITRTSYYINTTSKIHLCLDNITLLAE